MLFQILDSKHECKGIYYDGQIVQDPTGLKLSKTWAPSKNFEGQISDFGLLWARGQTLTQVCPEELKPRWQKLTKKANAFIKSFSTAKVSLDEVCFYDLVPEKFLLDFFDCRNKITEHVFNTYQRPHNHDFMRELMGFLDDIKTHEVKVNLKNLDYSDDKVRTSLNKIKDCPTRVIYNPWTTVTGRLASGEETFPILTLNKELRAAIEPQNDCFVELDYNAAELRVLFGLLGQDQPEGDVHEWIAANIFEGKYDREKTKKKVFSWLYNPKAKNKKLNEYLNRDQIYSKYYIDGYVNTLYNRKIKAPEEKAVNYLIQSTTSDMFITSAIKINKLLTSKKSFVSFCIHDSLVLDFSIEDRPMIEDLISSFSQTQFGKMRTNLSIGKNFGSMKKIV